MGADLLAIKGLCILDNDGKRVLAKYYDDHFPTLKDKLDFEANLFKKTNQTEYEIIVIQGLTVVYKSSVDLLFYVIGSHDENELLLSDTLQTFYDTISTILRKNVEKKAIFDKIEYVILAADELVEGGVVLESEAESITSRVFPSGKLEDIPISEQTMSQVLQTAQDRFKWSMLR